MSETKNAVAVPDAARLFADFAVGLEYGAIPAHVVDCTKKLIIDQLGVMLIGATASGVPALARTPARRRLLRRLHHLQIGQPPVHGKIHHFMPPDAEMLVVVDDPLPRCVAPA